MSTLRLYDSTQAVLRERLPLILPSQRTNLALLVAAAAQAQSCHLADLARALAVPTLQASKVQRIRRTLDNERITLDTHYRPVVRQAIQGVRGQAVDVLLDRVRLKNHQNVVVASLGFRRRAVPLAWEVLDHLGSSDSERQMAVLEQAVPSLPPNVSVTVHGDAEFCTTALFRWIRKRNWHAMLGLSSSTHLHFSQRRAHAGQSIAAYYGNRRGVVYLSQVYVTEERFGPVNLLIWWDGDEDEPIRAVMTDLPANGFTFQRGRRRMWIETLFHDWQSSGFHLDQTGLESVERFTRLLIVLAIAYLLFLSVGRWVVKRSYRRLIDDGTPRAWHYSLFQLGVGWMIYCQSNNYSMPVILSLYP
ncbi:MAG: transposase [Chloroflexota bacterium]|nr:transposase [Chloroflexota bacterium]